MHHVEESQEEADLAQRCLPVDTAKKILVRQAAESSASAEEWDSEPFDVAT